MLSQPSYQRIWKVALLPVIDFLSVLVGIWVVYLIRYRWFEDNFLGNKQLPYKEYFVVSFVLASVVVILYAVLGLYEINKRKSLWKNIFALGLGILLVILSIITFFFFNEYNKEALPQGVPVSRFILATGGFVAFYMVLLGRLALWALEQALYQLKIGKVNIAIVGDNDNFLMKEFSTVNYIDQIFRFSKLTESVLEDLKSKMQTQGVSEIYLFGTNSILEQKLAWWTERYKVSFIFSPDGFAKFQSFGLKPIMIKKKVFLELVHSNLDGWLVVVKRLFDFAFALVFLSFFSWLFLLIAIAIKLDSKGSVFYLSERVGPNGKMFKIWKFRRLKQEFCTSSDNSKALEIEQKLIANKNLRKDGVLYKIHNDPRSTRVGRFLEKYSLDELPQFFNVLLGDLSIVGPRPHQPREVAKYQEHHYKVLNIKPGVTGFAQINGRSDLSFEEEVNFDTYYIEHWSFWLDLLIILKTPFTIFFTPHKN